MTKASDEYETELSEELVTPPLMKKGSISRSIEETESASSMNDSFCTGSVTGEEFGEGSFSFEMCMDEEGELNLNDSFQDGRATSRHSTKSGRSSRRIPSERSQRRLSQGEKPQRSRSNNSAPTTDGSGPPPPPPPPPPPRRGLSRGASMSSSSKLNRSLSNLSGCSTPLCRRKSKLCLMSQSNHGGSGHSIERSPGALSKSRAASFRRQNAKLEIPDMCGDDSEALGTQLEVDGQVLPGNKELSTSTHLRRRMPNRQRRSGSKREVASAVSPSSSEDENTDKLASRVAALSCE